MNTPTDQTYSDPEVPELPKSAQFPKGLSANACLWLDRYIEFSKLWSPRSFDGFHEAIGLWILSTIAARRVCFHLGKPRYTNLYIILGGRTTLNAKSSGTDIGRQVLRDCLLTFFLAPDESTPQSFISYLASGPTIPKNLDSLSKDELERIGARIYFMGQAGWYAEEFGSWIASMMRTDGIMADFRGLLRNFDDCPHEYSRSTITRNLETVKNPYLAILANLTPADLVHLAKKGTPLWGDGFFARFAFVTPPLNEVLYGRFPPGEREIPLHITKPLVDWHNRLGVPDFKIDPIIDDRQTYINSFFNMKTNQQVLQVSDSVRDAFYNYHDAVIDITRNTKNMDLDGNYGRLAEKALRISALFASLGGSNAIELHHWVRAQEIAERWRFYTHRLYHQVTAGNISDIADKEELILGILKRHTGGEKYPDGMTPTDVTRFMHDMSRIEVGGYLGKLAEIGVVDAHKALRSTRYTISEEVQK